MQSINILKSLLLNKYKNIIGKYDEESISIENIVDRIVYYYESIISCMPGNVFWLDTIPAIVGCNQNVLHTFGLESVNQFKGLTYEEQGKLGNHSIDVINAFKKDTLEVIKTGTAKLNVEEPMIPHIGNGRLINFLTHRVPLFDQSGEVIGVVGISFDITDRKIKEQALMEAKIKAEVSDKAKTEFIANMRHDIRTPLSGIVGIAELLSTERNAEKIKEFTECLIDSSKELLKFLNDILESINIASGEIPILNKTFSLKHTLTEVINLHKSKAMEKNIHLELKMSEDLPEYMFGDAMRIYRIILELLGNALKFTEQGYVKVRAYLSKKENLNYLVTIELEDTGCGISEDRKQALFVQFQRNTPSYKGLYKGYGLGLFIAKQFIEDLKGEIYIDSIVGKGSKFICIIPMSVDPSITFVEKVCHIDYEFFNKPNQQQSNIHNYKLARTNKILIVEDQMQSSLVLKSMLQNIGLTTIDVAVDGQIAIEFFKINKYDLIFMDIGLPDLNGYDVAKQIRNCELPFDHKIPIVALTAHFSEEEKARCLDADMNAIFTKPLLKEKLFGILKVFLPDYMESVTHIC